SEAYDDQNRLVRATINRYQKNNLGNNRFYPFLEQAVSVNYNPENGSHRSTAQAFQYDGYGNPTLTIDYGEVQLNGNDGAFGDIENDLIKQENTFTQNLTDYLVSLPIEQKVFDNTNQLIGHSRTYYDNLDFGNVAIGNQTRMETWLNTTNNFIANTVEYNQFGLPVSQTNPRGNTSHFTYDSLNLHPLTQTNALGHTATMSYDAATGQLLQSTDANDAVTKNTFDGLGRLIKTEISHPNSGSLVTNQTIVYGDTGMPRSIQSTTHNDDGIQVTSYTYLDGLGRSIETKSESSDGKWSTTATIFDKRGNIKKSIQPYFSGSTGFEGINENRIGTNFTYDALGQVLTAVNPLGTTSTQYDIWDKTLTDPNGKIKDFKFDVRGQLIEVGEHLDSSINRTKYSYDSIGNLIQITDTLNNVRDFTYDNFGRRLTQTDAHAVGQNYGIWQYSYDENNNLIQRTDPLNQTIQYTYDELDRMISEDFLGESGTEFTFLYDQGQNAIGRLSTVSSNNYQHNYEYDLLGRVLRDQKQIDGRDFTFTYEYDLMGGVKKMMYPDDMEVFYSYDSVHQLSKVYSGDKVFADQFEVTPLGQLSKIRIGGQMVTTSTYKPAEMYRLKQRQTLQHGVVRLQDFQYNYDAMGNLMKLVDQSSAVTSKDVDYLYDDLYRLTEARYTNTGNYEFTTMNYQYNAIGNMVFKSDVGLMEYRHHNPHAVTKAGDSSYDYDLSGNMTDHNGDILTYNYRGRMTQSGDGTNYFYDEANQRLKKGDKYYPNKYYEIDGSKEVKYIFAGSTKIAKVVRALIEPPVVNPIEGVSEGQIEDPSIVFNGTKEAGLAMWVNGIEILPAGPETEWEYSADLIVGDNIFEFYTKEDVETASKRITQTITYDVPAPVIEPVENPTTSTRILLNGTKRTNTSIWINGEEAVPIDDQANWQYEIALPAEQNSFEIHAEDRLNQAGESVQLNLTYLAQAPTVDDFDQPIKANPFTITGTKAPYMSVWINGEEVVPMNDQVIWQASLKFEKGINSFNVISKNEFGVESNGIALTIPYDVNAPTIDPV
ncbi:RHS repeat protein, partial [Candidatus Pacearchaeota archaeon]|nr:RHS repeat protein [Candidatus Pacearchaeota archaeon]